MTLVDGANTNSFSRLNCSEVLLARETVRLQETIHFVTWLKAEQHTHCPHDCLPDRMPPGRSFQPRSLNRPSILSEIQLLARLCL